MPQFTNQADFEEWLRVLVKDSDANLVGVLEENSRRDISDSLKNQIWRLRSHPQYLPLRVEPALLDSLHVRLRDKPFEAQLWGILLYASNAPLDERIAHDLIDRGISEDAVLRSCPTPSVLRRLAGRNETAAYWLGMTIFCDPNRPADEFEAFARDFADDPRVWESLARKLPIGTPLEAVLGGALSGLKNRDRLLEIRRLKHAAAVAADGSLGAASYQALYNTGDPAVLRQLAANEAVPHEILRELSRLTNMKFARQIRQLALRTLARAAPGTGAAE